MILLLFLKLVVFFHSHYSLNFVSVKMSKIQQPFCHSRRRHRERGVPVMMRNFEESVESTIEYGPTVPKVKNITSGRDLMDNFGGSTKIFKQHLPHNTLFEITNLRTSMSTARTKPYIWMLS